MRVRSTPTFKGFGAARSGNEGSDTPDQTPLPSPPPAPAWENPTVRLTAITPNADGLVLTIRWTAMEGHAANDWIGIYTYGAPNSAPIAQRYVPASVRYGTMDFQVPPGAFYEARYFPEGGSVAVAKTNDAGNVLPPPPAWKWAPGKISPEQQIAYDYLAAHPQSRSFFEKVIDGAVGGVKYVGGVFVRGVNAIGGAVNSAINFVAGGFPTPADYDPENLCVTAWTDPPKFALLTAAAAVVFPPAVVYMGAYVPPSVAGLTLGLAEALARGGPNRVITKILDPLYNSVKDLAGALLDYAFNGTPALVRWAIKKVAERLPDDVLKGILLAASEAADSIVEAIKSANKLKDEAFYVGLGDAITQASAKFFENNPELRSRLAWIGAAIKGGGAAVAVIVDKGVSGVQQAFQILVEKVLGIPADFDNLSEKVRAEIANAKTQITGGDKSPIDLLHILASNLKNGIAIVADALRKIPFRIGEILGGLVDLLGQLVAKVEAFIVGLLDLARRWASGDFNPPAPAPIPAPAPTPTPAPTPVPVPAPAAPSGGLFLIFGAAVAGGLLAGPAGAIGGAAAGALLGKGK